MADKRLFKRKHFLVGGVIPFLLHLFTHASFFHIDVEHNLFNIDFTN